MSRKATEPSPDTRTTHVIQYTAFTPDDGESAGVATVTAVDGKIPFAELAKIPGFRSGDILRASDDDPRPRLLGPGTDTPGHAPWCRTHDDETGDGTTVCLGQVHWVEGGDEDEHAGAMMAGLVVSTGETPRMFLDRDGESSVSLSAAREYALLLLSLIDQAEAEMAVSK